MADQVRAMVPQEVTDAVKELETLQFIDANNDILYKTYIDSMNAELNKPGGFDADTVIAWQTKYLERLEEIKMHNTSIVLRRETLQKFISQQESTIYKNVLTALQHDNPQQVSLVIDPKFSKAARANIEEYARLIYGMRKADPSGAPYGVYVKFSNARCASGYTNGTPDIRVSGKTSDSVIVHELLHTTQKNYDYGKTESEAFAAQRTAGEKLQRLNSLYPGYSYGKDEVAYKDAVDNAYTLKVYNNRPDYQFREVLTMAMTDISTITTQKDKGLLEVAMQIFKGNR
jgi:hypothetical protein